MKLKLSLLLTILLISLTSRTYSQVYLGSITSEFPLTSDSIVIPNSIVGLWIDKDVINIDSELFSENDFSKVYVFETYNIVKKINEKVIQIDLLDKQDEGHRFLSVYQGFISQIENSCFLNLRKVYYDSNDDEDNTRYSDYYISKFIIKDGYLDLINIDSRKECSTQNELFNFFKLNLNNSYFYSDTKRFYKLY